MTRRHAIAALLVAWSAAAVAFGVWDLGLVRAFVDRDSAWGWLVARWGELPGLATIFAALVVLARAPDAAGWHRRARAAILTLLTGFTAYYMLRRAALNLRVRVDDDLAQLALVSAALGIGAAAQVLAARRREAWPAHVGAFARTTFWLALLNPVLFVSLVKPLWGRVRPRDLAPDALDFTPWFAPQGVNGHVSFPSGHAALGWMVLPLVLLARRRSRPVRAAVTLAAVAWGLFVAAGRVRIGAHYPSDVLFSTGVALTLYAALAPAARLPAAPRR